MLVEDGDDDSLGSSANDIWSLYINCKGSVYAGWRDCCILTSVGKITK